MLMTVDMLKEHIIIPETLTNSVLEVKLQALELLIRKYTNNNFQVRGVRRTADIIGGVFVVDVLTPFNVGDTVQVSESDVNQGVYEVISADDSTFTLDGDLTDENDVVVTKVKYPVDIQIGAANMIAWDINNRSKVGIQSETISRHSVTYFNMDGDNSLMGYPKSLLGFLKPYKKARF